MQAVRPRQVEDAHGLARAQREPAFLSLDAHARVIGDLLLAAAEAVEQRRLACVRVADQRRQAPRRMQVDDGFVHAAGWLGVLSSWMQAASAPRKANVDWPMRTTSGSPPRKPRA